MWEWSTIARSPTAGFVLGSGIADGEEVERAIEVAVTQGEVRRRDRRHEAVVERPRDPQRPVQAVPPHLERDLVRPELAGVEQAQDLDGAEVGLQQPPVLAWRVLAKVPGVVRLLGAGRRERETVGRGD